MKSFVIGLSLVAIAASTFASTERDATNVVKKYSESVACQIVEPQYQKLQYKAVRVFQGDKDLGGLDDIFVVFWDGDTGCSGGNGSVISNFTIVEQRGFMSTSPVVVSDFKFPPLELARVTGFTGKNGQIQISGLSYGPQDDQGVPTTKVNYILKLDQPNRAFVLVNR